MYDLVTDNTLLLSLTSFADSNSTTVINIKPFIVTYICIISSVKYQLL